MGRDYPGRAEVEAFNRYYDGIPRRYLETGEPGHVIVAEGDEHNPTVYHLVWDGERFGCPRCVEACEDPSCPEAGERWFALGSLKPVGAGSANAGRLGDAMCAMLDIYHGDLGVNGRPPVTSRAWQAVKDAIRADAYGETREREEPKAERKGLLARIFGM